MKTFREFCDEIDYRQYTMWLESKGFKSQADQRRKKEKEKYLSPREAKLKDLKKRSDSWRGLR